MTFTLVLQATMREIDKERLAEIVAALQRMTDSFTIQVSKVEPGSVRITLTMDAETAAKLAELRDRGQLEEVCGFRVQAAMAVKTDTSGAVLRERRRVSFAADAIRTLDEAASGAPATEARMLGNDGVGARAGDPFGLVTQHQRYLYIEALHFINDGEAADALVEATLQRALQQLPHFNRTSNRNMRAWLKNIMRQLLSEDLSWNDLMSVKFIMSLKGLDSFEPLPAHESDPDIDMSMPHITPSELSKAVQMLPLKLREVMELELAQLSYQAIADRLNLPRSIVVSRLMRAKKGLKELLAPRPPPQ